jgi:hypothetical protein
MVRSLGHPQKLAVALFVLVLVLAALVARAEPALLQHRLGPCRLALAPRDH